MLARWIEQKPEKEQKQEQWVDISQVDEQEGTPPDYGEIASFAGI